MLASVDEFLDRKLDENTYNCLHLSDDIWFAHTGERLRERLEGLMGRLGEKKIRKRNIKAFRRLDKPVDPCIVIMQLPRHQPHMGVYLRGKVLHFHGHGVEFLPVDLASRGFKTVKFYR